MDKEILDIEAIVAKLDSGEAPVVGGDDEAAQAAALAAKIEAEQNPGATETPPTGESKQEGQNEPEASAQAANAEPVLPAIEPPASWNAAEKEKFSKLDRHLQEYIAERERDRERFVNGKANEAAEARKAAEAERTRIAEERQKALQQYDTVLNAVIASDPIIVEGRQIDWARLATTDPETYTAKKAIFDDRVQKLSQAIQQREQLAQQVMTEQQKAHQERVAKEHQTLLEKVQEWREDPERMRTAIRDVVSHVSKRYGISEQEFANVSDHRAFLMARDNMAMAKELEDARAELARLKATKEATLKEIEAKKASQPAPKVVAPKAASEAKGPSDRTKALLNQARKSGKDSMRVEAVMAALSGAN